jgi:D-inositol-3-phosphate glycosyltransferase
MLFNKKKNKKFNNRVAYIEPSGSYSGMHYYNAGASIGLLSNNIKPFLFTDSCSILSESSGISCFNYFKKTWTTRLALFKLYFYLLGLVKSVLTARNNFCEIVHIHQFHLNFQLLFTVIFCKAFFKKLVLTVHDIESFSSENIHSKKILSFLLKLFVNKFIVHNKFSFDKLPNPMKSNAVIIKHGNYIPFFKALPNNVKDEKFKLLFFGLIKESKGLDILLKSLVILKQSGYDFHLTIAGRSWRSDFKKYQKIIDSNDLNKHVTSHLYFISEIDLLKHFNNCDLVVLPYKKIYQSGVVLKSMSLKRPVLCSNLPAFEELIFDGENGFIFESENSNSLAIKLIQIISQKEQLCALTDRAYTILQNDFSWEKIGLELKETYINIYEKR